MKDSKRICVLIPYFGTLPINLYTFLLSCKRNKKINWIIFTDQNFSKYKNFCSNVKFIKSSLLSIKRRILSITGLNHINLDKPYKMCDYKPLYGLIFSKFIRGYDYWGYSDLDIVYGNLYHYIIKGIKSGYSKIGKFGHFTLFKNTKRVNNLYKLPIYKNDKHIYLFRDIVSQVPKSCHFDEYNGINIICKQHNIKTYINKDLVNDISFENLDLRTLDSRYFSKYSCYIWNDGHDMYFYKTNDGVIHSHEYGYFHFQKRHAFVNYLYPIKGKMDNIFSITTYGYNRLNNISSKVINHTMELNNSSFIKRFIYLYKWYLEKKMLHINLKHVFVRVFIKHNFKI